jgi:hypothetical protein
MGEDSRFRITYIARIGRLNGTSALPPRHSSKFSHEKRSPGRGSSLRLYLWGARLFRVEGSRIMSLQRPRQEATMILLQVPTQFFSSFVSFPICNGLVPCCLDEHFSPQGVGRHGCPTKNFSWTKLMNGLCSGLRFTSSPRHTLVPTKLDPAPMSVFNVWVRPAFLCAGRSCGPWMLKGAASCWWRFAKNEDRRCGWFDLPHFPFCL